MFRLLILLPVAFLAGAIYQSQAAAAHCTDLGGTMRDGVCRGVQ
ncbi:MAG: hypothetical protein AAGF60_15970 [Pseudomonadota bacterium]